MLRKLKFLLPALAGAVFCSNAFASGLTCGGQVQTIAYHTGVGYMLKLTSMNTPVFICDPDGTFTTDGTTNSTGPETCKSLVSTFISAKAMETNVNQVVFDGNNVPADCTSWAGWSYAVIRYIEM